MKKKYSSCRNVCGCKVSWSLADVHWGVFSQPGCTGDTAASIQKRICSSWPAWALPAPAQAHLVGKAGQDRHPRWKGHRISWKCLLVFHSHKGSLSNYVIINIGGGLAIKNTWDEPQPLPLSSQICKVNPAHFICSSERALSGRAGTG